MLNSMLFSADFSLQRSPNLQFLRKRRKLKFDADCGDILEKLIGKMIGQSAKHRLQLLITLTDFLVVQRVILGVTSEKKVQHGIRTPIIALNWLGCQMVP